MLIKKEIPENKKSNYEQDFIISCQVYLKELSMNGFLSHAEWERERKEGNRRNS